MEFISGFKGLITFNMICPSSLASITDTAAVVVMASIYDDGGNGNCCYVRASRRSGNKNKFFAGSPYTIHSHKHTTIILSYALHGGEIWLLILTNEYRVRICGKDVIV